MIDPLHVIHAMLFFRMKTSINPRFHNALMLCFHLLNGEGNSNGNPLFSQCSIAMFSALMFKVCWLVHVPQVPCSVKVKSSPHVSQCLHVPNLLAHVLQVPCSVCVSLYVCGEVKSSLLGGAA